MTTPPVTYGSVPFTIGYNKSSATVSIPLNAAAQRILKRKSSLNCNVVVTGKDYYGTATVKTPVTIPAR